jgi:RND family efflux transporter MFP subunit
MRFVAPSLTVLLLTGCGGQSDSPDPVPAAPKSVAPASANVSTVTLAQVAVYPQLTAQAQVTSRNISKLAAQISARIVALPVEPGQKLARGALVARLDCSDYLIEFNQAQANLAAADAQLKLAEQQLKRSEDLAARNFISGDALDQRRTEMNVTRAQRNVQAQQVSGARQNVSKCTIAAPFPAIVESKQGNVGELAEPGTPLATLWDIGGLEVMAQVQTQDAESLPSAKEINLVTPDGRYPLKLKRLSTAQSTTARTQESRLALVKEIPNPGASGRIEWTSGTAHVPADYLVSRNNQLGIFVAENGHARFVALPDAQEGRPAPVPLPADTALISNGRFALNDGQPIQLR